VCHTGALSFTLKNILKQKKNYENSNISPCKNMIFKETRIVQVSSFTLYKIIGICLQIFDLAIHDWLEPPSPLRTPAKVSGGEAASGKERDGVPVSSDATKLSHSMR